ncbi:MAG TPA: hypothetical protein IAA04_09735 [Candidatus Lachnoclostridium pullistercoris]|uniref:Uncharacterized protein n=1 Tax=Candidatus Lachnoclostridium pullistercoris TaxID=2838632 RepID=A0A9D2PDP7_9FIRM|nr:hypothetical protein [Candidatus Lachnoclostridium pullistercoris]
MSVRGVRRAACGLGVSSGDWRESRLRAGSERPASPVSAIACRRGSGPGRAELPQGAAAAGRYEAGKRAALAGVWQRAERRRFPRAVSEFLLRGI